MRGTLHRQKGRGEVSRHLSGQHRIVEKMKSDFCGFLGLFSFSRPSGGLAEALVAVG
jgi:hypothetical protein